MPKYNITDKQENPKKASYKGAFPATLVEDIAKKIIIKLLIEEKYRDPKYSAKHLAADINVNMRHISAVVSMRFQQNYSELVAGMRVREARYMLGDRNFDNMTVEDIATKVGFTTRQSFYATFYKLLGTTPKEYRVAHGFVPKAELPPPPKPKKKTRKKKGTRKQKAVKS
ncbi:MAG: AraC family transcriptional regulator [Bacteroidaceae bacterium]|nr:AraC family transcriptional regulator [Bacteroidaceae bacterium]MBQ9293661.1 AraC family transcriptional regulator [Bacteroidaceae bacterium]